MSPEERQAELDNISAEELAKIQRVSGKKIKVYEEDLLLAEFAIKFGWQAYLDVKGDKITTNEMSRLIAASRRLEMKELYILSQASLIGSGSAQSKHPMQTFKSMTAKILRIMEADK